MSQVAAGVVVTCGSCGSRLRVRAEADGKIGKCPKCGVRFQIAVPRPHAKQQQSSPPHAVAEDSSARSASVELLSPHPRSASAAPEEGQSQTSPQALSDSDWKRGMSPEVLQEIEAEQARLARQGSISIAVLVFASLIAGAAVCFHVARYGGAEHWVVKRSVAAWLVGMMTAAAMLVSSGRRCGALRFLAAVTAAAAVVGGKLFSAPLAEYSPIDLLFAVMAIAGSAFTFILAEPSARVEPPALAPR